MKLESAVVLVAHVKKVKVTATKILIVCLGYNVASTIARMNFLPVHQLGIVPLTVALSHRKYRYIVITLFQGKYF